MKGITRFDPVKFNRALAARGLDGDKLAKLAALDHSTVSRARRGKSVKPITIEKADRSAAAGTGDRRR